MRNISIRPIITMKRSKGIISPATTNAPPPPTTPQQTVHPPPSTSHPSKKPRNIKQQLLLPISAFTPLNIPKAELSLPLTFPTGQTFRWKQTGPLQYTGVIGSHLISLKHLEDQDHSIGYYRHCTNRKKVDYDIDEEEEESARVALLDFLNMSVCLSDVWEVFKGCDSRFAELALYLEGARVLRQDPLECLIQFICSSNNNIGRITKMVDFISSLGIFLGTVEGLNFYQFPTLESLAMVSEAELREAGFGYRAKYITGTVDALLSKPSGGMEWLTSLRKLGLQEAIGALSTLPGIGPKVAACIALFSLDQHHAIPVDTHVWQIATRYLIPELAGTRLTPRLHNRVADAFVSKYGKYAGWAQTLLFIAELPSQKELLPASISKCEGKKLNTTGKGKGRGGRSSSKQ